MPWWLCDFTVMWWWWRRRQRWWCGGSSSSCEGGGFQSVSGILIHSGIRTGLIFIFDIWYLTFELSHKAWLKVYLIRLPVCSPPTTSVWWKPVTAIDRNWQVPWQGHDLAIGGWGPGWPLFCRGLVLLMTQWHQTLQDLEEIWHHCHYEANLVLWTQSGC